MSIGDCLLCMELMDAAAVSIKRHLEATSDLAAAVQNDAPEKEISTLRQRAETCTLNWKNAVATFERHLAGHSLKAMTAGSSVSKGGAGF